LPLSFAADFPDKYVKLAENERGSRALIGSDQCIIDSQWFFLRGILEIPIIGNDESFLWGLWVSVLEGVFNEISECWELEGREKDHGPYNGRLANSLPVYPETLDIEINVNLQPVSVRPLFVIEDAHHPMAMQQQSGVTQQEAIELASTLLHLAGRDLSHP
jgi:hypothetical protein